MPFTEWPYGGTQNIGVTRPNSVNSPLMVALGNTQLGQAMSDAHIQVYGWINGGGNISTNNVKPGGNAPAAYDYTPNTFQLDQAVLYIERLADTTQNDHFDWGFRIANLYGENYRYTTAYGFLSNQLLNNNQVYGYDVPMVYVDLYFPVLQGMDVRIGRFISIPDIEAQLAPNNYTYVHSLTYSWDNYTNTGIAGRTPAVTKNWIAQVGLTVGSDTMPWNIGQRLTNPHAGQSDLFRHDDAQGSRSSAVGHVWAFAGPAMTAGTISTSSPMPSTADSGAITTCNGIGATYYHKLNDYWHMAFETYNLHENNVPNLNNPTAAAHPRRWRHTVQPAIYPVQCPGRAHVHQYDGADLHRRHSDLPDLPQLFAEQIEQLFTARRMVRRHGGTADRNCKTRYVDVAGSWQHWLSPQVELRPEIAYYRSLDAPAFNGNANAGIPPSRNYSVIGAADIIWHF